MKGIIRSKYSYLLLLFTLLIGCKSQEDKEHTYYDKTAVDTIAKELLIAVTDEEYLQYGVRVAYLNTAGDTIIPFGKYAYLGTDTLAHYANVMDLPANGEYGRWIAIDRDQNILYDVVPFDNGPDYFMEGLVRVKRNGKMGYANKYGQIVIPCEYAFASWFENGRAEVTYEATVSQEFGDHTKVSGESWFTIDIHGNTINDID